MFQFIERYPKRRNKYNEFDKFKIEIKNDKKF